MSCLQRSRDCNTGGNKGFSWCKKNVYGWSIRMRKTEFHFSVCYGWDTCVLRLIVDHSTMWFYFIVGILFTNQLWINNRNWGSRCSMFHVWKWSLGKPCDAIMIHAPLPPLYDNWMHLKVPSILSFPFPGVTHAYELGTLWFFFSLRLSLLILGSQWYKMGL